MKKLWEGNALRVDHLGYYGYPHIARAVGRSIAVDSLKKLV